MTNVDGSYILEISPQTFMIGMRSGCRIAGDEAEFDSSTLKLMLLSASRRVGPLYHFS